MANISLKAGTSQTGDLVSFLAKSGANGSSVNKDGYIGTELHAAPADADIATGEVFMWFDQTAGTPVVKFRGRDSAGTLFTKSL